MAGSSLEKIGIWFGLVILGKIGECDLYKGAFVRLSLYFLQLDFYDLVWVLFS